jgi:hypothetical protein
LYHQKETNDDDILFPFEFVCCHIHDFRFNHKSNGHGNI